MFGARADELAELGPRLLDFTTRMLVDGISPAASGPRG
jgi:hypothetical protein